MFRPGDTVTMPDPIRNRHIARAEVIEREKNGIAGRTVLIRYLTGRLTGRESRQDARVLKKETR